MRTTPDAPHEASPIPPTLWKEALAIGVGGALGATLRHAITIVIEDSQQHSAFGTAVVNMLGAFLLGMMIARIEDSGSHPMIRPFLVVGVFGSFTTFSALAFDNRTLASQHGEAAAVVHMLTSIVFGLLAFAAGSALVRRR